jgi:membrane glycosyltransferase
MSPLWLLLLALSTADAIERAVVAPVYWNPGFNLFPKWPISPDFQVHLLLAITLATLFLPKLLGLLLVVFDRAGRRAYGGLGALLASVLVETVFSTLVAPVMMLFQTVFVGATLAGRAVQWDPQPRDDRGVTWREAFARHAGQTLLGVVWGALVLWIVPGFIYWLLPMLAGLLAAVPVSVWSSRIGWGRAAKRSRLFLTPEETRPPSELRALRGALAEGPDLIHGVTIDPAALVPPESGIEMPHRDWKNRQAVA